MDAGYFLFSKPINRKAGACFSLMVRGGLLILSAPIYISLFTFLSNLWFLFFVWFGVIHILFLYYNRINCDGYFLGVDLYIFNLK